MRKASSRYMFCGTPSAAQPTRLNEEPGRVAFEERCRRTRFVDSCRDCLRYDSCLGAQSGKPTVERAYRYIAETDPDREIVLCDDGTGTKTKAEPNGENGGKTLQCVTLEGSRKDKNGDMVNAVAVLHYDSAEPSEYDPDSVKILSHKDFEVLGDWCLNSPKNAPRGKFIINDGLEWHGWKIDQNGKVRYEKAKGKRKLLERLGR